MFKTLFARIVTAVFVVGLVIPANAWAQGGRATQTTSPMLVFGTPIEIEGAFSTLIRTKKAVTMTVSTSGLLPGGAYTNWWVFFNNPGACAAVPCGLGDLGTAAVNASIAFAAGNVVGGNGVGHFASYITEGDASGALFGPGLLDARGAEIHLIVRSHGLVIPNLVAEQISTVGGACGINVCTDEQASIHLP